MNHSGKACEEEASHKRSKSTYDFDRDRRVASVDAAYR